jgi:hypothetical protein
MSNRTRRSGLIVTGAALVVGALIVITAAGVIKGPWSESAQSARSGQAPAVSTGSILVRVPPGKIVATDKWPHACQLLTDADLAAVLPDATEVESLPGAASTVTIEEYAADPAWRRDKRTDEGRCAWNMKLPGERVNAYTTVWIRIVAVADPELIRRYHDDQATYRGGGVAPTDLRGGGSCVISSLYAAYLVCAGSALMFEIGGSTTTDFGDYRAYGYWRDTVLPEFAVAVASKIRTG